MVICEYCKREFRRLDGLTRHLKSKGFDIEQYYNEFLSDTIGKKDPHCLECGDPSPFISLSVGYDKYCHNPYPTPQFISSQRKKTCLKKYGVSNPSQLKEIKEKRH